jgi:hypothetical protein
MNIMRTKVKIIFIEAYNSIKIIEYYYSLI